MSLPHKNYEVFISFRGEDTRTNFTSHLHSALKRAEINTYIDDECLEKTDDVWGGLSSAIKDSEMAVVVFSEDYAYSKWCLDELVYILKCRDREGLVVLPVFYEVDPSDIRKQTGKYGEAFAKHERELLADNKDEKYVKEKVSEWKAALFEAANISGRVTRNREFKNEAQAIEKIVEDVRQKLEYSKFPKELKAKDIVGLHKIDTYVTLLQSESRSDELLKNAQVIGIWGMGGVGKTAIAKVLFSRLFQKYDGACFLENVRESSQNQPAKLKSLRQKLLSELLKDEDERHMKSITFVRRRLSRKRVFIVLDDVDTPEQLEALCEDYSYAGPGSKLIITTRDKHLLLGKVETKDILNIETWHFEESLELFCLCAFNQRDPKAGYEDLSRRAVKYAGGLPLALKVLGSILHHQSTEFWDSKLNELKQYPNYGIENVLRVSYDGLDLPQQKIFLDIAFFFKDENKDLVERILNACGFFATNGLKVLEDKALISISSGKRIQMHDLVQRMGLNIVRQANNNPGNRSRLRGIKEVSNVLACTKKGTDAVEGISLDLSRITGDLHLNINAFSMMTDIRFLKLYIPSGKSSGNMDYPIALNEFSGELRYLEWHGYCLKFLPETTCTKWLVEIHMPHSHITELWHGVKNVMSLERLDLSECKHLTNLPDLSAAKLKWVNLSGCESLHVLHPSILSLDPLETLILDGCQKLSNLKSEKHLKSLENISVNGCTSLQEFALSSDMMEHLDLKNAGIEKLHPLIGRSWKLLWLNLEGLRLQHLATEISSLRRLEELRISNCDLLVLDKENLHDLFDGLRSLRLLHLKDCCNNLFELPDNIGVLSYLRDLALDGSSVQELPANIRHLTRLEIVSLRNCKNLKSLPKLPACIKELYVDDCTFLETLSTLKTSATIMKGRKRFISFENSMELDEPSRHRIMEGAQLSAMSATFNNVLVGRVDNKGHGRHNYDFLKVCSPGSSVPGQCQYRSTTESLTVDLVHDSNLLGLVLFAVLPPSDEIQAHGARIFFQCYKADGTKLGDAKRWRREAIKELKGDHVYIWYDPILFDNIVTSNEREVTFKFFVKNGEETGQLNIGIKECGVRLIFDSELPDLLRKLDMDFESRWKLGSDLASALGLSLGSELRLELESMDKSNNIHNQPDQREICSSSYVNFAAFRDHLKRMFQREKK